MSATIPKHLLREAEILGALERLCQTLELTPSQHAAAKEHYDAVGEWLAASSSPLLAGLVIYPHGSVALGTTVKPYMRNEHDVDLVSHMLGVGTTVAPTTVKAAVGARLREHAFYASILEEKRRCWRLNYAGRFHLDVTPSIVNPACANGGELVPDKELRRWKPTNPRGYKHRFDQRALLQPRFRLAKALEERRADVEPFPAQTVFKGILRRTVQLSKRHRDIYFETVGTELAPISVIVTTLASRAYELCVAMTYDTELQFVAAVIRAMPNFIEGPTTTGHPRWAIWNETTHGENFAEKWNTESTLARAFFAWHAKLVADIDRITTVYGLDQLTKSLSESFGPRPAQQAMSALTESVSTSRARGELAVVPHIGLSTGIGTAVRGNTFYGRE